MIDTILKIIAPHHCYGCQKVGSLLCEDCKYDIVHEPFEQCVNCRSVVAGNSGSCHACRTPYDRSWAVGERHETLEAVLNGYKFSFQKESAVLLADLLDQSLPYLPPECVVTYIPTISQHIRQRGYDHARLIAHAFAKKRSLELSHTLQRITTTAQRGSSRRQRFSQMKSAFSLASGEISPRYLILDDIFTTGATMKAAASILKQAGASEVYIAVIARQPLD